jgi:hypothetical protein
VALASNELVSLFQKSRCVGSAAEFYIQDDVAFGVGTMFDMVDSHRDGSPESSEFEMCAVLSSFFIESKFFEDFFFE